MDATSLLVELLLHADATSLRHATLADVTLSLLVALLLLADATLSLHVTLVVATLSLLVALLLLAVATLSQLAVQLLRAVATKVAVADFSPSCSAAARRRAADATSLHVELLLLADATLSLHVALLADARPWLRFTPLP